MNLYQTYERSKSNVITQMCEYLESMMEYHSNAYKTLSRVAADIKKYRDYAQKVRCLYCKSSNHFLQKITCNLYSFFLNELIPIQFNSILFLIYSLFLFLVYRSAKNWEKLKKMTK
jgi:hypothetical protein